MKIISMWGSHPFPIASAIRRRLYWLWWEPIVLLLPWRWRVVFWNWLFDATVDYTKHGDPFLVQWLQNYWPFGSRWIPESIHWALWKYCFREDASRQHP
jgi:hypothetical protein